MSYIKASHTAMKYLLGSYPSVWQLHNPSKVYEFEKLVEEVRLKAGHHVLDLGCGHGRQTQLLAKSGVSVVGVDPIQNAVRTARWELKWSRVRHLVKFIHGTLESANLPPETLDFVFSFCVFEHIHNLGEVLLELHHLLKPGGEIHATVDTMSTITDPEILEKHRNDYHVVQYFQPDTICEVFAEAGFKAFHHRYILASDYARDELIRDLRTGNSRRRGREMKSGYARLIREEKSIPEPEAGLMILCRARKE